MEVGTTTEQWISTCSYHPNMLFQTKECWINLGSSCLCSTLMSPLCCGCRTGCSESHPHSQNEGRSRSYRVHEGSPWCRVRHHRGLWGNNGCLRSEAGSTINAGYGSTCFGTDIVFGALKILYLFTLILSWLYNEITTVAAAIGKHGGHLEGRFYHVGD